MSVLSKMVGKSSGRIRNIGRTQRRRLFCESLEARNLLTVFSVADSDVFEKDGTSSIVISVDSALPGTTIQWSTSPGSAIAGTDYTTVSGTASFDELTTQFTIHVPLTNDTLKESGETFYINLSNPVGGTIGKGTGIITINDNDAEGSLRPIDHFSDGGDPIHTGATTHNYELTAGFPLQYSTLTAGMAVIDVRTKQPQDSTIPSLIKADLTVNNSFVRSIYYNTAGLSAGAPQRFVFNLDGSALASGTYDWEVKLTETVGSHFNYRSFGGAIDVYNRSSSPIGKGWEIGTLDKLAISTKWATVLFSNGATAKYKRADILEGGGGGGGPSGEGEATTAPEGLVEHANGTYTYTTHFKSQYKFSSSGQLNSIIDANNNKTVYTYAGALLTEIKYQDGRTVGFGYTNGKLSSVMDWAGRITSVSVNGSNNLTSITSPDPDGAGPKTPSISTYSYFASNGLMQQYINPRSNTIGYSYDAFSRLNTITYPGAIVYSIAPQIANGLLTATQGTSSSPVALPNPNPSGVLTRASQNLITVQYDSLGYPLVHTDPLGNTTTWERDVAGNATKLTLPDSDGTGPLVSSISTYVYDANRNLSQATQADGSVLSWTYDAVTNRVTKFIDAAGFENRFVIDTSGNVTQVRQVIGQVDSSSNNEANDIVQNVTYTSNPTAVGQMPGGLPLTQTDARGNVTSTSYGSTPGTASFAKPTQITFAVGTGDQATRSISYGSNFLPATVTNEIGKVTSFSYDNLARLLTTSWPDPDGAGPLPSPAETRSYDANSNLASLTDHLSNTTSYVYDNRDRISSVTLPDPDGTGPQLAPVTSLGYDAINRNTSVTNALGKVTTYNYNVGDQLTSVVYPDPDGTGPLASPQQSFTYDKLGRVITSTDPLGRTTTSAYNSISKLTSRTLPDPDGSGSLTAPVWQFGYDIRGLNNSVTDPLGRVTSLTYDAIGRQTAITYPDPDGAGPLTAPLVQLGYDKTGNITSQVDAVGNISTFAYDFRNRQISKTAPDPDGSGSQTPSTTSWTLNGIGKVLSRTNSLGKISTFGFDSLGRGITATLPDPDGSGGLTSPVLSTSFDAAGNVASTTDEMGKVTSFQYDKLGRKTLTIEPDPDGPGSQTAPQTSYTYDALGQMLTLTDAKSNTTTWTYDNLGRAISEKNALNKTKSFSFDAASQVTSMTDRNGRVTNFTYDNLGQMLTEKWMSGTTVNRSLAFSYYAVGNLSSASDPAAAYLFSYDNLSRLTQTTVDYGTGISKFRLLGGYDSASRRTSLSLETKPSATWVADLVNTYTYDGMSRQTQVLQTGVAGGNAVQDKRAQFTYNLDSSFNTIVTYAGSGGSTQVTNSGFIYDNLGRMTSLEHTRGSTMIANYDFAFDNSSRLTQLSYVSSVGASGVTNYTYDNLGQLTVADHNYITDETYSYDATGNRTMAGYTTGTNNRLTSDGTFNYAYDDEGNLITRTRISSAAANDKTTEYQWDYRNRLTTIIDKNNSGAITKQLLYGYDLFNRRISKSIDSDGAGPNAAVVSRYVFDGGDIALVTNSTGVVTQRVFHGPSVDQVLAIESSSTGQVLWALSDQLGSVRDLVDSSGTVKNHLVYDSYGRVASETDAAIEFLYGYTGRERDKESGLNFHRARYYDPATGRWISEDPLSFGAGDTNVRRYVGNDPVNYNDPSGLVENQAYASPENNYSVIWGSSGGGSGGSGDWLDAYAGGFSNMFGSGWGNSLGGYVYGGITTFVSNDTLAGASANKLAVGTTATVAVGVVGAIAGIKALVASQVFTTVGTAVSSAGTKVATYVGASTTIALSNPRVHGTVNSVLTGVSEFLTDYPGSLGPEDIGKAGKEAVEVVAEGVQDLIAGIGKKIDNFNPNCFLAGTPVLVPDLLTIASETAPVSKRSYAITSAILLASVLLYEQLASGTVKKRVERLFGRQRPKLSQS
jgi:RHS repeat-associated protein